MTKITEAENLDSEPFATGILDGATFKVEDWTGTIPKKGGWGGEYSVHSPLINIKGVVVPIRVELPRKDFDTLRLLKMQGIKVFSCTLADDGNTKRRIYSGGKDW